MFTVRAVHTAVRRRRGERGVHHANCGLRVGRVATRVERVMGDCGMYPKRACGYAQLEPSALMFSHYTLHDKESSRYVLAIRRRDGHINRVKLIIHCTSTTFVWV